MREALPAGRARVVFTTVSIKSPTFLGNYKRIPGGVEFTDIDFMKQLTLKIRIAPTYNFRIRKFLGLLFIRLAAWVMTCGLEVDDEAEEP